ncbi:MAG: helix-turn-helix domain-containing protein [Paracoccus sp. (in: a-proteobacteria)]
MEIREVFARNLRILRQARGLSQEELAHSTGIDRTYISSLERSIYNASLDVVDRLATVLDVKAMQLLDPDADAVMRLGLGQKIKARPKTVSWPSRSDRAAGSMLSLTT